MANVNLNDEIYWGVKSDAKAWTTIETFKKYFFLLI